MKTLHTIHNVNLHLPFPTRGVIDPLRAHHPNLLFYIRYTLPYHPYRVFLILA